MYSISLSLNGDHARAVRDVLKFGIDSYMAEETAKELKVYDHHRVHIIKPLEQFTLGDWKIKPFRLKHDVMNLGFLLQNGNEKILYAIDTNYIPFRFTGLTKIMVGVNYDVKILKEHVLHGELRPEVAQRTLKNHMSLQTAVDFFKANNLDNVSEIFVLHLSDGNSHAKNFKRTIQEITGRPVYITEA